MDEIPVGGITDEELTALALASRHEEPAPDAVPDARALGRDLAEGDLPIFYMPPAMGGAARTRWARPLALGLIGMFVVIEAAGFCTTYGSLCFG